jgi:hypothetical protein
LAQARFLLLAQRLEREQLEPQEQERLEPQVLEG